MSQTTIAGRYLLAAQVDHTADGATVHQATDRVLARQVSITIVPAERAALVGAAGTVQHRHLLPVHEHGVFKGTTYLVADPYAATDVFDTAGQIRIADPSFVRSLVRQLAAALDALHQGNLVHLGIEPRSIRLDPSIHPVDPGTVRLGRLHALQPTGTVGVMPLTEPSYMAPEIEASLLAGYVVADPAADRWALAAVAYTLLTGQAPFPISEAMSRSEIEKMRAAKAAGEVPPVGTVRPVDRRSVPSAVDPVLRGAMAPDPSQRPSSATAFADAFSTACDEVEEADDRSDETQPNRTRSKRLMAGAVAAVVLLGGVATWRVLASDDGTESAGGLPAAYQFVRKPLADGCGAVEPAAARHADAVDVLRCSSSGVADQVELVRYASIEDRDQAADRLLDERVDTLVTCSESPLAPAQDLPAALACFQPRNGGAELVWSVRRRPVLATVSTVDDSPAALEVWLRQAVPRLIEEG